jgi:hypothetical protein
MTVNMEQENKNIKFSICIALFLGTKPYRGYSPISRPLVSPLSLSLSLNVPYAKWTLFEIRDVPEVCATTEEILHNSVLTVRGYRPASTSKSGA